MTMVPDNSESIEEPTMHEMIKSRRMGRFSIGRSLLEQDPALAMLVLSKVAVSRCECFFDSNTFEYWGWSEDFAPVPLGQKAPWYDVYVNVLGPDGPRTIEFRAR